MQRTVHIGIELLHGISEKVLFHPEVYTLVFLQYRIDLLLVILSAEEECVAEFCLGRIRSIDQLNDLFRCDSMACHHGSTEGIELCAGP